MSERVLIVDDDPVQRRLLDNMVRKFGYEPVIAEGGDAAAALLTGPEAGRTPSANGSRASPRSPPTGCRRRRPASTQWCSTW